ncbi:MAG: VWA domain-containing protein, partial [archaeon]|nr:VWA domain-containing protein [archaeon]
MNITYAYENTTLVLLLIGITIIFHLIAFNRAKKRVILFSNFETLKKSMRREPIFRSNILLIIRIFAYIALVLAISHTTLIFTATVSDTDIVYAFDNSYSMFATDNGTFSPNKLEKVKTTAFTVIDKVPVGTKMSALSFGGTEKASSSELTANDGTIKLAIENIGLPVYENIDVEKTMFSAATILETSEKIKVIVILSDGNIFEGADLNSSLEKAKEAGIIINTVGIGIFRNATDHTEEDIPERLKEKNVTFKDDVIFSPDLLQYMSNQTGGRYMHANNYTALDEAF